MARVTEGARLPGDTVGGSGPKRPAAPAAPVSPRPGPRVQTRVPGSDGGGAPPPDPQFPNKGTDQGDQPIGHGPQLPGGPDAPVPPGSDTGGGDGGGGKPPDHSDLLGIYGLPPDLAAAVDQIFRDHPNDPQGAAQAAIAYIRGTDWYRQTFPGIDAARQLGYIGTDLGSEREYRQYYLAYNQLYQQYYHRAMTWQEAFNLFSQGISVDTLGRQFAGAAYVTANQPDIQYLAGAFTDTGRLTGDQLTTYGQEQAGIDTPLGQMLKAKLDQAQAKLQTIFSGTLATPSLTIGGAGLSAPNLLGTKTTTQPDVPA